MTMSDRSAVHPRTRNDLDAWRMRTIRRRDAMSVRRVASRKGIKVATVVDIAPNGDVKVDRLTDEDGNGEWLTPVNGRTPPIGSVVVMDTIEGVPAVVGAVGEGTWQILPDHALLEPAFYFPDDSALGGENFVDEFSGTYNWRDQQNHPFLSIDPMNPRIYFGAPPFFAANTIHWHDHFLGGGTTSGAIGRENWATTGSGSISAPGVTGHWIRLASGTTSGNIRDLFLGGPAGNRTAIYAGGEASGIMESWFFLRILNTTSCVVRAGFGNNISSATDPLGMYWEFNSTGPTASVKLRNSVSFDVDVSMFTWEANQPYLISVRTEPDRSGDVTSGSLFTWTQWGFYYTYPGGVYPIRRHTALIAGYSGLFGGPEIGIRTLTAANRQVELDYAGGFSYDGQFAGSW